MAIVSLLFTLISAALANPLGSNDKFESESNLKHRSLNKLNISCFAFYSDVFDGNPNEDLNYSSYISPSPNYDLFLLSSRDCFLEPKLSYKN